MKQTFKIETTRDFPITLSSGTVSLALKLFFTERPSDASLKVTEITITQPQHVP